MDISNAYKQHQQIKLMQEAITETEKEVKFTETAYKLAFVATFLVYFIFVWMMYVSDLWGFTTWLIQNLSEVAALVVYSVLAVTLPLAMAMIKEIGYKHFAKYQNSTPMIVVIVGILAFAGVIYEAISSSSQQQHISTKAAEGSKTFQAISNTNINVVGISGDSLALASQKLARCEENLKRGKEKHCEGDKAKLAALKASQQAQLKATETASTAAFEAKQKAMQEIKEDAYKPVFKSIRDSFGVSISTGVMIVTLFVSVIFEISHLLLILFLSQKLKRLEYLKQGLIQYEAGYMESTGKSFSSDDFSEFKSGTIPKPETSQDYKKPKPGFGFIPQSAKYDDPGNHSDFNGDTGMVSPAPLFKYQQKQQEPAKQQPFGFIQPGYKAESKPGKEKEKAQLRKSGSFKQSPEQREMVNKLAGDTYREELRNGSKQFRDVPLDRRGPALPENQKLGGTGLQNPALGTAEEHFPLPLEPQAGTSSEPQENSTQLPSSEPQENSTQLPSREPQAGGFGNLKLEGIKVNPQAKAVQVPDGLYEAWVRAVNAGDCLPSLKGAWGWIQKQVAGNQQAKMTFNNREIGAIAQAFFLRAVKDGNATMNPKYTGPKCGLPKYLWSN